MSRKHLAILVFLAVLTLCGGASATFAGEIGWLETFALATDRAAALQQLIPGTEDYYYYYGLHYLNTQQWEKADQILKAWVDRYKWTPRAREIQNRRALLTYQQDPQRSLDLIRQQLDLHFNHQREELNQKPNLPTKLDPALLARERLNQRAYSQFPDTLQGFEDSALDWLVGVELNPDQRRQLLSRLQRPDHAKLVKLIVADLQAPRSGGFGQFPIHHRLLLAQLDECLKLMPDLRSQAQFVSTYLVRLQPSNDVNWRQDPPALSAYLQRLWDFVKTLSPAHNSLKAHVLYQRLVLDRSQGKYSPELFLEYLKLPKHVPYIQPKVLQLAERQPVANLQQDFSQTTLLPPVGDDEPLVRSYLLHFLVDADDDKLFAPYINDQYLKQVFAEAKIVNGLGDAEKSFSLMPPAVYQQLKERIDLDFAFTNKTDLPAGEPVALDLDVKNVETLIVKVFEINTKNYYRQNLKEVGTEVNLDGLVANEETTYHYQEPPLRRIRRRFEFPKLNHRGVYVIDFIGNGKASRALVHLGKLRYLVRTGIAGQVFTVLDEKNAIVPDATLWLSGTLYQSDKGGTIAVPFTNQPGRQPLILSAGGFSSLEFFQQEAENYALSAGFYVDREELLARRKAELIVRPQLSLGGTPVSRKILEDIRLTITSTDLDNVVTTKEVPDFQLFADRETTYEFQVPQRLATIRFQLKAKVQNQSQNRKVDLSAEQTFALNEIDRTEKTEDLHFARVGDDYVVDLLGKTGEVKPDRPLQVVLKLRDYTQPLNVSLQTNERGRAVLGPLADVESVSVTGPQGTSRTWPIRHDEHTYTESVQGEADQRIEVPYMGQQKAPARSELSLLELRGDNFVADRFDNLSLDGGLLAISKLPPGDYSLLLKRSGTHIRLRLTEGPRRAGYVLGNYRKLEVRSDRPLQMKPVEVTKETVRIQLQNVTPLARVHVFGTRFEPAYHAFHSLAAVVLPEPYSIIAPRPESQYVAGRDIGDEYRYILDRKFAHKYPGNMLERPSLLLNPWAVRSTETGQQEAAPGVAFGAGKGEGGRQDGVRKAAEMAAAAHPTDFADLDFLAASSLVVANVLPDKDGLIELKRDDLGPHQELLIVAVDPENTASRIVALPEVKTDYLDLRLAKGLDPKQHYMLQRRISVVPAGGRLTVADIGSTRFEIYDNLARVFALYAALNNDPKLAEFRFLRDWPSLKPAEKRDLYLKHASHELHFFLARHDAEFFNATIRPYLANKKEKQFLDRWLLGEDLTSYLKPWDFAQLNTFERSLLGLRIDGQHASLARLITDEFHLLPPDPERFEHLFETALQGTALDNEDQLGLRDAKNKAGEQRVLMDRMTTESLTLGELKKNGATPELVTAAPAPANAAAQNLTLATPEQVKRLNRALGRHAGGPGAAGAGVGGKAGEMAADRKADKAADELDAAAADMPRRERMLQYYRKLDKTMELVESNYYHLPLEQQNAALIAANAFWNEFANHDPAQPFFPTNMAEATHSFPEMLTALALLDLPFKAAAHKTEFQGNQMTLTAGSPLIAYHEEIQSAAKVARSAPVLVSQNFFRQGDRYRQENGEQVDRFVTEEFLVDVVYGCHIVVTNPGSSRKKCDVLLQIPTGAMPVAGTQPTRSVHLDLQPYHTQTLEYYFYFPLAGKYPHYPVQVGGNDEILAFAAPFTFNVVKELTNVDKQSWDYLSQHGTPEDVLNFLRSENLLQVNLERIAWRMQDKAFFLAAVDVLNARHVYSQVLWSYGVKHGDVSSTGQFLQFADEFVGQCGDWLDSPLLTIDPIVRRSYEQMDYRPLVNARVGQLGRHRQILNDRFLAQYQRLLKILSYRRQLNDVELMSVTYYLLLQDRVEEAMTFFGRVDVGQLATRLQYDYFDAYLDFYKSEPKLARQIAARYADYPVERWQKAFADVLNQADEIERNEARITDKLDRSQQQTSAAAATPAFDFTVEGKTVKLNFQNIKEARVNYYRMDVELLFSRNPFVRGDSRQFSNILPNVSQEIKLPAQGSTFEFPLPESLASGNVLVEIVAAGQTQSQPYYSGALQVQLVENYGQARVTYGAQSKPLAKVYVKVYARMQDGRVTFYKDGYTDLRGRFDYSSLSTNELDYVDKFSLLILSEEHGAVVREAKPPKQ
jgi:hypothetical protein